MYIYVVRYSQINLGIDRHTETLYTQTDRPISKLVGKLLVMWVG